MKKLHDQTNKFMIVTDTQMALPAARLAYDSGGLQELGQIMSVCLAMDVSLNTVFARYNHFSTTLDIDFPRCFDHAFKAHFSYHYTNTRALRVGTWQAQ